jgi:hypothetical protein
MPGQVARLTTGPETCEVVENIIGGQLVEYRAASKVGVAGAASAVVAGWATQDAAPLSAATSSTDAWGNAVLSTNLPAAYLAVQKVGEVKVTAAAVCAVGILVKAAANGQVTPWTSGTDGAEKIVGRVTEPAGIGNGAVGRIRLGIGMA